MQRRLTWAAGPLCLIVIASWVFAAAPAPDPGSAEMVLEGGDSGDVPFPHRRHQELLADCTVCHSVFPQKAGAIEELKSQGKLQKKEVMNTQCTKCHKERRRAGQTAGPTTCTSCHSVK